MPTTLELNIYETATDPADSAHWRSGAIRRLVVDLKTTVGSHRRQARPGFHAHSTARRPRSWSANRRLDHLQLAIQPDVSVTTPAAVPHASSSRPARTAPASCGAVGAPRPAAVRYRWRYRRRMWRSRPMGSRRSWPARRLGSCVSHPAERSGPRHLASMRDGLTSWMNLEGFTSIAGQLPADR